MISPKMMVKKKRKKDVDKDEKKDGDDKPENKGDVVIEAEEDNEV